MSNKIGFFILNVTKPSDIRLQNLTETCSQVLLAAPRASQRAFESRQWSPRVPKWSHEASNRGPIGVPQAKKLKKQTISKNHPKSCPRGLRIGFWQAGWVGNGVGLRSPKSSAHLALQNLKIITLFVRFSILNSGGSSPHFSNQSVLGLFYSKPPRTVSATELELRTTKLKKPKNKPTNLFSNLDFLSKSEFPKILDLFMDFQGFPTPWISHPMDFGFSGRPRERPTKTKIGRQGRISRLPGGCPDGVSK